MKKILNYYTQIWLLCICVLFLFSCEINHDRADEYQKWTNPNGRLKVLSTTGMIGDLVQQIGKDHVDALVLIGGQLDPHSYQLVKGDDEKFTFADLIFYNGLNLEHGPSLKSSLESNKKAFALGDAIMKKHQNELITYKGQPDPHIWMDISLWNQGVELIVSKLSEADPDHAKDYVENGRVLMDELIKTHEEIVSILKQIPKEKRYLVTSHDAFNYFARAYLKEEGENEKEWKERFIAPEGLAPESQISLRDIQTTIDHLIKYKIQVIFPESNVNHDSIEKIVKAANEKGLNVTISTSALYADAMGKKGSDADTYIKMIKHNALMIQKNLIQENL